MAGEVKKLSIHGLWDAMPDICEKHHNLDDALYFTYFSGDIVGDYVHEIIDEKYGDITEEQYEEVWPVEAAMYRIGVLEEMLTELLGEIDKQGVLPKTSIERVCSRLKWRHYNAETGEVVNAEEAVNHARI